MSDKIPKVIYLQWYDSEDGKHEPGDEVTWCVDRINDKDLVYHLAPQWREIKSKKDLPPGGNEVLFVFEGSVLRGEHDQKYNTWFDMDGKFICDDDENKVTHWMPMPLLPPLDNQRAEDV